MTRTCTPILTTSSHFDEEDLCPGCGHTLDASTPADPKESAAPKPGDLSICAYCTAFMRFDDNLNHVLLTPYEIAELEADERGELIRAREYWTRVNAERRK